MRTLAAFAVVLVLAACQAPPAEMTEAEIAQIEVEIRKAAEDWFDGFRQHDLDLLMAAYHPTETSFGGGRAPRDYATVREGWGNQFENIVKYDLEWTETVVRVLSPDAAMFQGYYVATATYADGRIFRWPGNVHFTVLMERTPDGWKITMGAATNGTAQRMDLVYGVYDIISFLGEDWNTPGGPVGTYELMADGNSVLTITVPGEPEEVSEVEYSIGDRMVDGCFTWGSTDEEGNEYTGTICDGVFTVDGPDGIGILHKRQ